nr:zinc finger, CCHC-type [Tanacetum cinerariifolium]
MTEEDALLTLKHECGTKYMAEDASSKTFFVSDFTNYKMTNLRPVLEQDNKLLDFKHTLKYKKEELTLVELVSHLYIEESLRVQDNGKPKSNNVDGPSVVNMVEHNHSFRYNDNKGKRKHHDNTRADPNKKSKVTCWKCRIHGHLKRDCKGVNVGNKANGSSLKGQWMDDDVAWWVDSGATVHDDALDKFKVFKTEVELQQGSLIKRFRTDREVSINSIIESMNAIFDENRFSSALRPGLRISNGTEDTGGTVVLEKVTEEVVQQPEPELRKSKRNRALKNFGPELQLYLIEGTRDDVSDQHSYCFNVEDDPKTFDEAMNKFDETGKGFIICLYVDDMLIFSTGQVSVDPKKEFLSSRFSMKDMEEADVIIGIRIKHKGKLSRYTSNPGTQHWQAIQRVLKYLNKTMDYRSMYTGYPLVLEGYTDASWISNTEDNSSIIGRVFLLSGGVISWAFNKQTCITSSTMKFEFVALAAAGKEAEWLKNLLFEILLWVKPMAPISICDSAAALAKAYSHVYNEKSRHLGVRHNMIRELITNRVESEAQAEEVEAQCRSLVERISELQKRDDPLYWATCDSPEANSESKVAVALEIVGHRGRSVVRRNSGQMENGDGRRGHPVSRPRFPYSTHVPPFLVFLLLSSYLSSSLS